jgi:hypothetical protein
VLWNPQDFFYTCDTHLIDSGFATAVEPDPSSSKVNLGEDDLKKIKEEWEERQKKKKEQEEQAAKEKEKANKESTSTAASWVGWVTGSGSSNNASSSSTPTTSASSKTAQLPSLFSAPGAVPSHQKFVLNRQIFAMRQAEVRKKRNQIQANAIAPRLPIVPGNLS